MKHLLFKGKYTRSASRGLGNPSGYSYFFVESFMRNSQEDLVVYLKSKFGHETLIASKSSVGFKIHFYGIDSIVSGYIRRAVKLIEIQSPSRKIHHVHADNLNRLSYQVLV